MPVVPRNRAVSCLARRAPRRADEWTKGALALAFAACLSLAACDTAVEPGGRPDREDAIPDDAVKVTPETDVFPPIVHDPLWSDAAPMPGPVNTAGAEDSPFMAPDGRTFLFWFTPDVDVPAGEQAGDGVTGIWCALGDGRAWSDPVFVDLSDVPSLEGCPTLHGSELWFCSIRGGNYGEADVWLADHGGGALWTGWRNAGQRLNGELDVGEWHLTADGETLYFGADRLGGLGESDLWMTRLDGGEWSEPVNLGAGVNTPGHESRPFVTADGSELWFMGSSRLGYHGPAVFRATRGGGGWGQATEIVSNYAAEPVLDAAGNLYFAHHFMDADQAMIEADIYVASWRGGAAAGGTAGRARRAR